VLRSSAVQWTLARVKAECAVAAGLEAEDEEDLAFWDVTNGAKYARLDDDLLRTAEEAQITEGNELLLQEPVREASCHSAFEQCLRCSARRTKGGSHVCIWECWSKL